jgi:hypothetical protein
LPILKLTDEIEILSVEYHDKLGLPQKARMDVIHLAYVVAYEIDYLLTWNCSHLANGLVIQRLQNLNIRLGRKSPIIITPEELLVYPIGG